MPNREVVRCGAACPTCDAAKGEPCEHENGVPRRSNHRERVDAFMRQRGLEEALSCVSLRTYTPAQTEAIEQTVARLEARRP